MLMSPIPATQQQHSGAPEVTGPASAGSASESADAEDATADVLPLLPQVCLSGRES